MTTLAIMFEGINGAGKTTLLQAVSRQLAQQKIEHEIISRDLTPAASLIGKSFIGLAMPPESEICLRIAREYINALEIKSDPGKIYLLDRSLLTILALLRVHQLPEGIFYPLLDNLYKCNVTKVAICCTLPYEIASARISQRSSTGEKVKPKLIETSEANQCDFAMYQAFKTVFATCSLLNHKLILDTNAQNVEACAEQVLTQINHLLQ